MKTLISKVLLISILLTTVQADIYQLHSMSEYEDKADFVVGNGNEAIHLFVDPDSSLSKNFIYKINTMDKRKFKNFKFYVHLYPFGTNVNSNDINKYIFTLKSEDEKKKALKQIILNNKKQYKKAIYSLEDLSSYQRYLNDKLKTISKLGVVGTPMLFDGTGNPLSINILFLK